MSAENHSPAPPEKGTRSRLRLRERRVDFSMLFREMHYCYGRMIGLEGIALWSWYRLHQHGGGRYEELTGYGWTGQPSILAAHGIKHHVTLSKIRDQLIKAGLLVLVKAQDIFTEEELEALRTQAKEQGERLNMQKGSYLTFVHDPLTREDFVRWSKGSECPPCPISGTCSAYSHWQAAQGVSKNDIPLAEGVSKNDTLSMSKNDTKPDRMNQIDNSVVVALIERGISKGAAHKLAKTYAPELIQGKIELLDYLLETESPLVAQNPAGYLRKAIEENYTPPPGFQTRAERVAEREREAQEKQRQAERWAEIQAERRKPDFRERVVARYGTGPELVRLWDQARAELALQMTTAAYQTYIQSHTMLISMENGVARIAVNNRYIQEWLKYHLRQTIQGTLERLLGHLVEVEFILAEQEAPKGEA